MRRTSAQDRREIEVFLRNNEYIASIPQEEYVAYQTLLNDAEDVWHRAKEENDYAAFEPYLAQIVEINDEWITKRVGIKERRISEDNEYTSDFSTKAALQALERANMTADQLDLICNLKKELDKGNAFAADWLGSAVKRLRSPAARQIAELVLRTDHNRWWYGRVDPQWWVRRGK